MVVADEVAVDPLLERCEAMLTALQWAGVSPGQVYSDYSADEDVWCCPVCRGNSGFVACGPPSRGVHGPDCALVALLADLRKELK